MVLREFVEFGPCISAETVKASALICLHMMAKESALRLWWEWSPMACAGFLQRLWEKLFWEGVWPYLDPMDSVCLRTVSVEWNVPGKYGSALFLSD